MPPLDSIHNQDTTTTITAEQISNMSMSEYAFYRDRLLTGARGAPLSATSINIETFRCEKHETWSLEATCSLCAAEVENMTCMWCAAGPFATAEELESHEEQC